MFERNIIKDLIGSIWSALINNQLDKHNNQDVIEELLEKCDRHPVLLRHVIEEITVITKFGFIIKCNRRDYIGRKVITEGIWEPLVANTIANIVRPGDFCIDIGANIGFDTLIMSKFAGPDGSIMSFEPDWSNIKTLIDNLQLNHTSNVKIFSLGLGDTFATGLLDISDERGRSNLRPEITTGVENWFIRQSIAISPLSALLSKDSTQQIRLIKLDIEGFEYKALTGAHSLLNRVDAVICEIDEHFLAECGDTPSAIFSMMRAKGFKSYCAEPESTGMWIEGNESFFHTKSFKSGHKPFDTLFVHTEKVDLELLRSKLLLE